MVNHTARSERERGVQLSREKAMSNETEGKVWNGRKGVWEDKKQGSERMRGETLTQYELRMKQEHGTTLQEHANVEAKAAAR
jgi:hypothetical protein